MNLTVRTELKQGSESEGTAIALINALNLVAAVHPDFKGNVSVSAENLDGQTLVSFDIDSLQVNWGLGLSTVYENGELLMPIEFEEAKTRIRELTSPKVDQPAPNEPKAAEIQWSEPHVDSETNLHFILGGGYKVEQFMSGGKIYYRAQFHDRPWDLGYLGQHDSFEDGQAACQAHKQRRLNELL